ncbi:MAG: Mpo1-like protein [Planctomycetota bacterium]
MFKGLSNWMERHQNPVSFGLHLIGIPLVIAAAILAGIYLWAGRWSPLWQPAGLTAIGYLLQWIGHRIEGNDMGEVVIIKKLLGRPYVALSPRYTGKKQAPGANSSSPTSHRD